VLDNTAILFEKFVELPDINAYCMKEVQKRVRQVYFQDWNIFNSLTVEITTIQRALTACFCTTHIIVNSNSAAL
jgi:hypothetical protein